MPQKHVTKSNRRIGKLYRKTQKIKRLRRAHRKTYKSSRKW